MGYEVGNGGQLTSCQSKHGFSCTRSKANPLFHEGLGANKSMVLVPKHSCNLPAPWDGDIRHGAGRLQLQRTLLQQPLMQQATAPG